MNTSTLPRSRTLLLNVTTAIVLLPFFAIFAAMASLLHLVADLGSAQVAVWEQCLVGALVIGVPLVALAMILWKGWSRLPLVLLLLAFYASGICQQSAPPAYRHIDLRIGQHSPTTGVDVFCNGVHLGKTPMSISRSEFDAKVAPWTTPPRQDRLTTGSFPGHEWSSTHYSWVPNDIFEQYGRWPPQEPFVHDNETALSVLRSSRHWWHFESDGHQGLCQLTNFGGGSHGSAGYLDVTVSPQITYPALQPHLALVIDALLAEKGPPSKAWIAHFRKYENLLFLPFYEKAQSDPRLRAALDAVVRAEFDLSDRPTSADCERILTAILDRAESYECFQIPSPESIAIDLMGSAASDSVVRHFREEWTGRIDGGGRYGGGSSPYVIFHRSGKAARLLPLEYAVKRLHPPELFDLLVYRWARTRQDLELIGAYQNETAAKLITDYYVFDVGYRGDKFAVDRALDMATRIINNQSVEQWLRNFVRDNAGGSSRAYYVQQFIESRIGATEINQEELASWVYHFAPVEDKLKYLLKIHSSYADFFLNFMGVGSDPAKSMDIACRLAENPNPAFDHRLIEFYSLVYDDRYPESGTGMRTTALIRTDTPAVRTFLTECWREKARRTTLLDRLAGQTKADLARLAWMTPLLEKLSDAPEQVKAARLLASFRTPEAQKLLDRWQREGDAKVRRAVGEQLEEQEEEDGRQARRLQQWADLLAGRIQPQDLVPPQKPWDWNGKQYVQEK
jgi:hypothetical protein